MTSFPHLTLALNGRALNGRALSGRVLSRRALSGRVLSRRALSRRVLSGLVLSGLSLTACAPEDANVPPVADAGPDQEVEISGVVQPDGTRSDDFPEVTLDGSASFDPDSTVPLKYFWFFDTIPVGSAVRHEALQPNAITQPLTRFTPDREGDYGGVLQVFDGQKMSLSDYVTIRVVRKNSAPVADGGPDLNGAVGSPLIFDGTGASDPDGDFLSYKWTLEMKPAGSLLDISSIVYPATPNPRITPDAEGVYTLAVRVFDGLVESPPAFVSASVVSGNLSPIPDAGPGLTITPCYPNPILLEGTASVDPEGDPMDFRWSVLEVPLGSLVSDASLIGATTPTAQVRLDLYGLYVFTLTLDDGLSDPASDTVAIVYDSGSTQQPPLADAGGHLTLRGQAPCDSGGCQSCLLTTWLDGGGSTDPNHDPLQYAWSVVTGDGTVSPADQVQTELIAPPLIPPGIGLISFKVVSVQLVVSDCAGSGEPSYADITFSCEGVAP